MLLKMAVARGTVPGSPGKNPEGCKMVAVVIATKW